MGEKIYSVVQSNHYCSRRLNATHQMGCTSELGGNFGVLWIVDEQKDLDHILKTGPTPPYIVVLRREHYTRKNLLDFKDALHRVTGVIFLDGNHEDSKSRSQAFSPEDRCPNRYAGLYVNDTQYAQCKQNLWQQESPISGLLSEDIPFPIFLINEKKSIDDIETCFTNNNLAKGSARKQDTYPLCSMQLDSFMVAASDTKTCLNSHSLLDELLQSNGQRCSTVENQNIFAFYKTAYGPLQPVEGSPNLMKPSMTEPQSVVMLIAKLSSLSMFSDISPGADSTITPIVTLLAVAEALGKIRNNSDVVKSSRNIAFALLDSEPFDYTGSSRMAYSMQNNMFPNSYFKSKVANTTNDALKNINLNSVDYVINLDQMAEYLNSSEIYLHVDPRNRTSPKFDHANEILSQVAANEKIKFVSTDLQLPLPPASVQEFIKQTQVKAQDQKLLGLVLSNYETRYNNLFYNSIYDDSHNVYQVSKAKLVDHITKVASFVAKSVFQLAFKSDKTDDIMVDRGLVEDLLGCYMIDAECSLFTKAWQAGQKLPSGPISTYKDPVKRSDDMNGAITSHLLSYFIGDKITDFNLTKCYEENEHSLIYDYHYVNGKSEPIKDGTSGICVRSQVLMLPAVSPAFQVNEDGISVDAKYPAWTVSLSSIRHPARLYLKPSPVQQWCVFFLGIVVTIMSFIVVHQIKQSISKLQEESNSATST